MSKPKIYTKFEEWFVAQFGERPTAEDLCDLQNELRHAEHHIMALRMLFTRTEQWELCRNAALKGWTGKQVVDKDAPPIVVMCPGGDA